MKLTIKILGGESNELEVEKDESCLIVDIKKFIKQERGIPLENQRIILKGKPLSSDFQTLKYYGIKSNCKLHVSIKKSKDTRNNKELEFWQKCEGVLHKHFSVEDANAILKKFTSQYQSLIESLSLDDLERIASHELE